MGRTHVDAANRLDSTKIVAVTGGSRAAKLADDYSIDVEPSVEAMVARDDIDAIVISTPHHLHCSEALAAAAAGKHALVEKPLSTSLADSDRMIEAFQSKGLTLSVGYHQRFRDSNKKTKELIQSGAIGTIRCIQMTALFDIEAMRADPGFAGTWGWWKDPLSIAHLLNSGPHNIDLCRWWLDSDLVSVSAQSGTYREDNPNENTTMALLSFANGTMVSYWSSSVLPSPGFPGGEFRFRFMGDDGIIDHDPYAKLQVGKAGEWETVHEQPHVGHEDSNSAFGINRMQAYCDQMQGFVDTIHGTPGGEGTASDGRAGVAGVLAMLESSKSQSVITFS
jgi:predicted dehydrogenase